MNLARSYFYDCASCPKEALHRDTGISFGKQWRFDKAPLCGQQINPQTRPRVKLNTAAAALCGDEARAAGTNISLLPETNTRTAASTYFLIYYRHNGVPQWLHSKKKSVY